jgi:hypothetical protein
MSVIAKQVHKHTQNNSDFLTRIFITANLIIYLMILTAHCIKIY